jgi:hypothetical protein
MARGIFVGDVHGCSEELAELFETVGLTSDDRVYFVGDVVARGPDSHGALALLQRVNGRSVRGNHEQRLLDARTDAGASLGENHRRLFDELEDDDWALLESFPLWLDIEEHDVRVVHGGVVPGIPVEAQDPKLLLTLRSLEPDGTPTSAWTNTPWGAKYTGGPHVVFGHNARQSVQIHPWATGLDTGCVYGGELTALVLPAGDPPPPADERRQALVSVPAQRRYYDYGRKLRAG